MNLGIYIHIPFCRKKCDYCSFYSIPVSKDRSTDSELISLYIKSLLSEIERRKAELSDYIVDTIYIGGGTPSLTDPLHIERIIGEIHKSFKMSGTKPEVSLELNPDDFSMQKVSDYKRSGINRVILGVQTFNKRLHKILGRSSAPAGINLAGEFISIPGIEHCLDLIIGIPGQTREDLLSDLNAVSLYRPEHISAYTLSIEANTPISARIRPDESFNDKQAGMLIDTIDFFKNAGYSHYEVSNYALPSCESRHNLKYWKFLPYAGFGAGAHSFYNSARYYNPDSVEEYIKSNGSIRRKDPRTKNSELVEYILSGMRLTDGITVNDLQNKLRIEMPSELMRKFKDMQNDGLIVIEEKQGNIQIKFSREGFLKMDSLIYEMTEIYL